MSGFELAGHHYLVPVPITGISADADRGIAGVLPCGPIRKGDDLIVYSRAEGAVDLTLANAGRAPILQSHHRTLDYLLGAITSAWVDAGAVCFVGRLAPVPDTDRIWTFLSNAFPVSLSLGAEVVAAEATGPSPWGGKRYEVSNWRLTEVSAVLHGADPDAYAVRLGSHEADEILATRRPAKVDAIRERLRVDRWTGWAASAGFRLAEHLGTDPDRTAAALQAEVAEHCERLTQEQAA